MHKIGNHCITCESNRVLRLLPKDTSDPKEGKANGARDGNVNTFNEIAATM